LPFSNAKVVNDHIRHALKAAGIERSITNHGLRHTWVSLLIASGYPVEKISQFAGHANTTITEKVYVHFFKRQGKQKNPFKDGYARYMATQDWRRKTQKKLFTKLFSKIKKTLTNQ